MSNNNSRVSKDYGFGNVQNQRVRMLNKDGTFNVRRKGFPFNATFNFYHFLLSLPLSHFIFLIIGWFIAVNVLFAIIYLGVGVNNLAGLEVRGLGNQFSDAFFFSTQTFTTVGYGRISPVGLPANIVSSLEALIGLMSFALITGLLYGRFSMPESRLKFSDKAIVAPYRGINAVMFRIANLQKSQLLDIEAQVLVAMYEEKNGSRIRSFYGLALERNKVDFFPTSWTVVHPIDDKSPFFGMNEKTFRETEAEILILFKAFDDKYLQVVHSSYSYTIEEIEWGVKFAGVLSVEDGWPVIDLSAFNDVMPAELATPGTATPGRAT
jgi:inward rectifier potassium channel